MNAAALPSIARADLRGSLAQPVSRRPDLSRADRDSHDRSSRVDRAMRAVAARGVGSLPPAGVQIDTLVPHDRRPGEPRDSLSSSAAPLRSGAALLLYSLLAAYILVFGILF